MVSSNFSCKVQKDVREKYLCLKENGTICLKDSFCEIYKRRLQTPRGERLSNNRKQLKMTKVLKRLTMNSPNKKARVEVRQFKGFQLIGLTLLMVQVLSSLPATQAHWPAFFIVTRQLHCLQASHPHTPPPRGRKGAPSVLCFCLRLRNLSWNSAQRWALWSPWTEFSHKSFSKPITSKINRILWDD